MERVQGLQPSLEDPITIEYGSQSGIDISHKFSKNDFRNKGDKNKRKKEIKNLYEKIRNSKNTDCNKGKQLAIKAIKNKYDLHMGILGGNARLPVEEDIARDVMFDLPKPRDSYYTSSITGRRVHRDYGLMEYAMHKNLDLSSRSNEELYSLYMQPWVHSDNVLGSVILRQLSKNGYNFNISVDPEPSNYSALPRSLKFLSIKARVYSIYISLFGSFEEAWSSESVVNLRRILYILGVLCNYKSTVNSCVNYGIFAAQLIRDPSFQNISLSCLALLQSEYPNIWVQRFWQYVSTLCLEPIDPSYRNQDGIDLTQCWSRYKEFKKSPFFSHTVTLVSAAVTACGSLNLDKPYDMYGLPTFVRALQERLCLRDISSVLDVVLEAIVYFTEVGHACFTSRSFKPILYTTAEACSFEDRLIKWEEMHKYAMDRDWKHVSSTLYVSEYNDLMNYMKVLHDSARGPERQVLFTRRLRLSEKMAEYKKQMNRGGLRPAPYCLFLFGTSSVGKTTVGQLLNLHAILASGGTGKLDRVIVWNESDDYFSGYTADKESIIMDDVANTHPDFLQKSPIAPLLVFNNNTPAKAVMADLDSKGAFDLEPLTVLLTSNHPTMAAEIYSIEPVSLMRRINVRATIRVRPEFATEETKDGNAMLNVEKLERYKSDMAMTFGVDSVEFKYPDAWEIDLEMCIPEKSPASGGKDRVRWQPFRFKDELMTGVSLYTACMFVTEHAGIYRRRQEAIVSTQKNMTDVYALCPCGNIPHACLVCDNNGTSKHNPIEHQFGERFYEALELNFYRFVRSNTRDGLSICVSAMITYVVTGSSALVCLISFATLGMFRSRWKDYLDFRERYNSDQLFSSSVRRTIIKCGGISVLFLILVRCYRMWQSFCDFARQSALNPESEREIDIRSAKPNPWINAYARFTSGLGSEKLSTATSDQFLNSLKSNLVIVRHNGKYTNGFYLDTNFLLVPQHFANTITVNLPVTIVNSQPDGNNLHEQKIWLHDRDRFDLESSDISVYYAPSSRRKDLKYAIPRSLSGHRVPIRFAYRSQIAAYHSDTGVATIKRVPISPHYMGGTVEYDNTNTYCGLCMGVVVSDTQDTCIMGFHLAGVTDAKHGLFGTVFQKDLDVILTQFSDRVLLAGATTIDGNPMPETMDHQSFMLEKPIAPRCPTQHLTEGSSIGVIGSCIGAASYRTEVRQSFISATVTEYCGLERLHKPPPLSASTYHWQRALDGYAHIAVGPPTNLLQLSKKDYLSPLLLKIGTLSPLSNTEVINGVKGDRWYNRMPLNSAVGFPLTGKTSNYMTDFQDDGFTVDINNPELIEYVKRSEDALLSGRCANLIFKASLKDEAIGIEKDKVRVFQAASFPLKFLVRKYYLPIARFLSQYPLLSECAVGIDAYSMEWDELITHVSKFGENRMIAGDFSSYDLRMPSAVVLCAFEILISLARKAGYSSESLIVMQSLATEVVFPLIAYNGTLIEVFGSNPSGQNLTVYVNSICNSLLTRSAFYMFCDGDFRLQYALMTYGDDDIGSVKSGVYFSARDKQSALEQFGMVYTSPTKGEVMVDYYNLCDIDFLKRTNVYSEGLGHNIGRLSLKSISKSLHMRLYSHKVTNKEWAGAVVASALREFFAYGRDIFEERREQLDRVLSTHHCRHHCAVIDCTYDQMAQKILSRDVLVTDSSDGLTEGDGLRYDLQSSRELWLERTTVYSISLTNSINTNNIEGLEISFHSDVGDASISPGLDSPIIEETRRPDRCVSWVNQRSYPTGLVCSPVVYSWPSDSCAACHMFYPPRARHVEYEPQSGRTWEIPPEYLDNGSIPPRLQQILDQKYSEYLAYWQLGIGSVPDGNILGQSLAQFDKERKPKPPSPAEGPRKEDRAVGYEYRYQSGVAEIGPGSVREVHQIMTLENDARDTTHEVHNERDDTYYVAATTDVSMQDYLSRPVRLGVFNWTVGSPFPPLIFNLNNLLVNKRNINRVATYSLFKADICVEILVNGSPFHYGALVASAWYEGFANQLDASNNPQTRFALPLLTQLPHVYVDPCHCSGTCLKIPYVHHSDFWSLTSDQIVATVTLAEVVRLAHASNATDTITITVMAWFENVVLAAPTANLPLSYVPQSGDEYNSGPVSRVSHTVAMIAKSLSQIAIIAPYAKATEIAAKSMGRIAQIFGFSRPTLIDNVVFAFHRTHPNYASTEQLDPINKLTYGDKQEVTVDPAVAGFGRVDEMSIVSIAKRESYISQFLWTPLVAPDVRLAALAITPHHYDWFGPAPAASNLTHNTPASWVARPFKLWRGSMRVRLRCVCSNFHRGRLRIVYEPTAITAKNTEYNVNYSYIWDISKDREAVIDIGWHAPTSYLHRIESYADNASRTATVVTGAQADTAFVVPYNGRQINGWLFVYVMNELSSPTVTAAATQVVTVTMHTSMLDDFEVAGPDSELVDRCSYVPQSGDDRSSLFLPVATKSNVMFGNMCSNDKIIDIYHGDPVGSIRQIVKRYNRAMSGILPVAQFILSMPLGNFIPGSAPAALHGSKNYVSMTPLAYFEKGFRARRGGTRVRLYIGGPVNDILVTRIAGAPYANTTVTPIGIGSTNSGLAQRMMNLFEGASSGWSGLVVGEVQNNGNRYIDFEVPYSSQFRFLNPRNFDPYATITQVNAWQVRGEIAGATPFHYYTAAADDYSLVGFMYAPPIHLNSQGAAL